MVPVPMATSVWMIDAGERYILCIPVDLGSYVLRIVNVWPVCRV